MSSLQDLTDAALDDFQFTRQRAPRDRTSTTTTAATAAPTTTVPNSTQYVPMAFRSLARSGGGGFGVLRSSSDLFARNSPSNSMSFQAPYRAQAGTVSGSVTNMNALFQNGSSNSAAEFPFRPNNASTSLTTLAAGSVPIGFNDNFTFAPPQGANALSLALHNASSRGSNSNLASAVAAQVTAADGGASSVEGLRLFPPGGPAASIPAPVSLLESQLGAAAAASAHIPAPPPRTKKSRARVDDKLENDDEDDDDDDDDNDDDDDDDDDDAAKKPKKPRKSKASAAMSPSSVAAAALVKRRKVSNASSITSAAATAAAHHDDASPTAGAKRKLSRTEAREKLRAEQVEAENALPDLPEFHTIAEASAYFARVRRETDAQSKNPKVRSVVARTEMRGTFVDLTDFLALPQNDAAKMIGVPTSTLSKRWKEVIDNRKWPYRTVGKLDKEIQQLLSSDGSESVRSRLEQVRKLLTTRMRVLMPVALRISKVQKLKANVLPAGLDLSKFGDDDDDDDDEDAQHGVSPAD